MEQLSETLRLHVIEWEYTQGFGQVYCFWNLNIVRASRKTHTMKHEELLKKLQSPILMRQRKLESAEKALESLSNDLDWYEHYNLALMKEKRKTIEEDNRKLLYSINVLEKELYKQKEVNLRIRAKTKTLWNPINWFDQEQQLLRKQVKELTIEELHTENKLHGVRAEINLNDSEISKLLTNENKYIDFSPNDKRLLLKNLKEDIEKLKADLNQFERKHQSTLNKIQPLLKVFQNRENELRRCHSDIDSAKRFIQELSDANNSYERKIIHQECERKFAEGNPQKVIDIRQHKKVSLLRDIEKLDQRICREIIKLSCEIDSVIIDGNNLCYESSEFVGLSPVVALANELVKRFQVTVFFDSGIRGLLKTNNQHIRDLFPKGVSVHIVAPGQPADYTILTYADNVPKSWIISNDRFSDFPDLKIVQEKRIFHHEIINGRVLVNSLDIDISYTEPAPILP